MMYIINDNTFNLHYNILNNDKSINVTLKSKLIEVARLLIFGIGNSKPKYGI